MANTRHSTFDSTVEKTNRILSEIEEALGWSKQLRNQSYAALRSVLHALRDRLAIEEAAQLAAQLPILVCGIFYHQWHPSRVPMKMNRQEFLQRVQEEFPFNVDGGMERLVRTVLQVLSRHVAEGEWDDIRANLPQDLASLLPERASQMRAA